MNQLRSYQKEAIKKLLPDKDKSYYTGKFQWTYGHNFTYAGKKSSHVLLGPCPICGGITISQGSNDDEW